MRRCMTSNVWGGGGGKVVGSWRNDMAQAGVRLGPPPSDWSPSSASSKIEPLEIDRNVEGAAPPATGRVWGMLICASSRAVNAPDVSKHRRPAGSSAGLTGGA